MFEYVRMDGWVDGWMQGYMDGWMDGCIGGWMCVRVYPPYHILNSTSAIKRLATLTLILIKLCSFQYSGLTPYDVIRTLLLFAEHNINEVAEVEQGDAQVMHSPPPFRCSNVL
jgi:hypothetical protein